MFPTTLLIILVGLFAGLFHSEVVFAKTINKSHSVKLSEFENNAVWDDGKHFKLGNSFEECEVDTGDTVNYTLCIENDTDDDVFLPGIDCDHYDKDGVFHDEDDDDEEYLAIINSLTVDMNPSPSTDAGFKRILFIGKGESLTINYSMTMRQAGAFASTLDYWSPCPDEYRYIAGRITTLPSGGIGSGSGTDYTAYYSYTVRAKWVGESTGDSGSSADDSSQSSSATTGENDSKEKDKAESKTDYKQSNSDNEADDNDDSYSERSSSGGWTPAPDSTANLKQTATEQLTVAQSRIAALSVIPATSKAYFKKNGMALDMTRVNTLDKATARLIAVNNNIPYSITFMFMGTPMICKIPADFNYSRFIKLDGTMNIHEVLWAVYSGNRK